MPRSPLSIVPARHAQGLAAYRSGLSLIAVTDLLSKFEEMHNQPGLSNDQHEEIDASGPSLLAGFLDGLIDDVRSLAGRSTGNRA